MVNKNSDQSEPVKFLYILITRIQVNDDDNICIKIVLVLNLFK